MTTSTDAILFYGYCWEEETSKPWNIGKEDDEETETESDWEARYASAKGLVHPTEPYPDSGSGPITNQRSYTPEDRQIVGKYQAYWDKSRVLIEASLCVVETHCSDECPMPYVAIKTSVILSSRGSMTEVKSLTVDSGWDAALADFCHTLGIDVSSMRPAWWLVSDWS